ncbi:hypothetical protein DC3_57100 [Deinococcus cellulosilyticus NBRC 106333 = KACC 11606]|uniref:DUF3052 domain-containing protein n=2 Tax=Deinococcus cellulosilyticus TaxID=401558 RepID=A0A511NB83_DEIC1|nr:hypothetical protein DC3_57100 [Deinococcus cellulosilyticus NBRC 106333 = KACC 11606]
MHLKPELRIQVFGEPQPTPEEHITGNTTADPDAVVAHAHNQQELEALLPDLRGAIKKNTLIWLLYPKGNKAFHRDTIHTFMRTQGLQGTSMISVDKIWSAMRFKMLD